MEKQNAIPTYGPPKKNPDNIAPLFTRILSGSLQSYRGLLVGRGSNRGGRGTQRSTTSTVDYGVQGAGQAPQGPLTQPGGLQEPRRATGPPPHAAPPAQQVTTREVVVVTKVVIKRVGGTTSSRPSGRLSRSSAAPTPAATRLVGWPGW